MKTSKNRKSFRPSSSTLSDTCTQGLIACLLVMILTVAIPAVQYWQAYRKDSRLTSVSAILICASAVPGIVGSLGLCTKKNLLLGFHIAVSIMFGAASAMTYAQAHSGMDQNCHLNQVTFEGCSGCSCALANTCESKDFKDSTGCTSCDAWPVDLCSLFLDSTPNLASATKYLGVCVVFLMAIPPIFSIIAIIGLQSQNAAMNEKLEMARKEIVKVLGDLEEGGKRSVNNEDELKATTKYLRDHGNESDVAMAKRVAVISEWESELEESASDNDSRTKQQTKHKTQPEDSDPSNEKKLGKTWAWGQKNGSDDETRTKNHRKTKDIQKHEKEKVPKDESASDEGHDKKSKKSSRKNVHKHKSPVDSDEEDDDQPRHHRTGSDDHERKKAHDKKSMKKHRQEVHEDEGNDEEVESHEKHGSGKKEKHRRSRMDASVADAQDDVTPHTRAKKKDARHDEHAKRHSVDSGDDNEDLKQDKRRSSRRKK